MTVPKYWIRAQASGVGECEQQHHIAPQKPAIISSMVLSTHAVIGAAAASIFPAHPVWGFFIGFASHFLADAIPHWHYTLATTTKDKEKKHTLDADMAINEHFLFDLLKIGSDALIGIAVALIFLGASQPLLLSATLFGALGGIIPDGLQFVYWKWRHEPLRSLQRFHLWIHAKTDYDDKPIFGPALQATIALVCVAMAKFYV